MAYVSTNSLFQILHNITASKQTPEDNKRYWTTNSKAHRVDIYYNITSSYLHLRTNNTP